MRSINTSLISVLPVLALMVVAVWLLGVGTLKDLALVMLVGIIVGTYSSIFFATPLLVSLRERTALVRTHNHRVGRRRGPGPEKDQARAESEDDEPSEKSTTTVAASGGAVANKPAPGARPARPGGGRHRPTGKRNKR
jgi:preprotein translocase subunit SecF